MNEQLLTVVLEEYKTLRAEVIGAVERQYSLAYWSISGIAVLIAALATSWDRLHRFPNAVLAIVLVAFPALATMYALAWAHVIAKIAMIGWYLHHVEGKVARLFKTDDIRAAYSLSPEALVDPFRYLLGWEHRLWRENSQTLVRRTMLLVEIALGGGYIGVVTVGIYAGAQLHDMTLLRVAFSPPVLVISVFWAVVWVSVVVYLQRITAVGERVRLGPRAESVERQQLEQ